MLERRAPPTFDMLVEIQTRDRFAVHVDIQNSVDALLRGFPLAPEIRTREADGQIQVEKAAPPVTRGGFQGTDDAAPRPPARANARGARARTGRPPSNRPAAG